MRNAYIRKHFSFPISVYFNPLTNNHENMRNENENSWFFVKFRAFLCAKSINFSKQ